jgi:hypothetical protein
MSKKMLNYAETESGTAKVSEKEQEPQEQEDIPQAAEAPSIEEPHIVDEESGEKVSLFSPIIGERTVVGEPSEVPAPAVDAEAPKEQVVEAKEKTVTVSEEQLSDMVDKLFVQKYGKVDLDNPPEVAEIPEVPSVDTDDMLTKLISDPEGYKESLVEEAMKRIEAKNQAKADEAASWDKFYSDNADLVAHREVVDVLRKAGVKQDKLAERTRGLVNSIQGSSGGKVVDTSSSATLVSSSGNPAPERVMEPVKESSFASEMKLFKQRFK